MPSGNSCGRSRWSVTDAVGSQRDHRKLAGSGALRTCIAATFPMAKAAEAHALLESGQASGKFVLVNDLMEPLDHPGRVAW
ncbi:zinc-binding dehydrogenase [Streptomyces anulatus]|uniref:zinc-binding dehydrogenase n=1 Tax=Streptomyces anulatus TaxID=1892 RepID=UPI003863A448|nr:zinc-binding dehydrogenase [Streptomyces anulatus]WTE07379.1 zinc-binding dehydrogenase [Streptomyces anulatus]